jgi:hypothetical protein
MGDGRAARRGGMTGFTAADERIHPVDPDDWSWNESWFFSFIDLDGGPAGFFRVGVLPNQRRAMLWCFVHVGGAWLGVEESRLALDDLVLADGVVYDKWGLRFGWEPLAPLAGARFTFEGTLLARSGAAAGAHVPVAVELSCAATAEPVGTGTGDDDRQSPYAANRFEQPFVSSGTVAVDGDRRAVRAGAHRDRSWGPREWRQAFTLGDLQADDRQLYFVGRSFPGLGGGFVRDGESALEHVVAVDGSVDYDDEHRTITSGKLRFEGPRTPGLDVELVPVAPSVAFDMAHTCEVPEHWLYWRTLVEAKVSGWDGPCRGWFETSRYGCT